MTQNILFLIIGVMTLLVVGLIFYLMGSETEEVAPLMLEDPPKAYKEPVVIAKKIQVTEKKVRLAPENKPQQKRPATMESTHALLKKARAQRQRYEKIKSSASTRKTSVSLRTQASAKMLDELSNSLEEKE